MCNLYDVGASPVQSRSKWEKLINNALGDKAYYVAPSKPGPVVRLVDVHAEVTSMRWGFHRPWSPSINNARDDKLDGRTWSEAWKTSRCLIPLRRFYEWSGDKGSKIKHAIQVKEADAADADANTDNWFWIGGIWEQNPKPGIGLSFSMLTTSANDQMKEIHSRMPVILDATDLEEFLISPKPPRHLIKPYTGELSINPPGDPPWF
ncbi:MAG: putative SOS response-associated peptidase YedK [Verrucomicrobiales bacterium]|jgi:putative SOS response-associated peptidase YedK